MAVIIGLMAGCSKSPAAPEKKPVEMSQQQVSAVHPPAASPAGDKAAAPKAESRPDAGKAEVPLPPSPARALTSVSGTTAPAGAPPQPAARAYSYNPEGRRDPFAAYLLGPVQNKSVKASIPLLNYPLSDLKLVAVMVMKKNRYLAMVQTPDSKGYVVKLGMEIGIYHGHVREITDHPISVVEEFTEIGGEKKKRNTILSLRPPEEGQL